MNGARTRRYEYVDKVVLFACKRKEKKKKLRVSSIFTGSKSNSPIKWRRNSFI
ncbi:hypothetical protein COCC4DRAFT_30997 [Bipolaris maydis ATCC 48331]|uniref:Uncharacterized protein n=2 Tax=Cochliobolus heterostrophus TaxID=5016 RepID=M2V1X7_COCH5|nr:uncharacterized protein COCC4DRAFT_30997 [Bipolaris maydis ATCC 48331]EMD94038.1 hypothetical protein COCHEDRAFT_1020173 [Bipolaris maydis C5]ENI07660.1 hypothetical protein COCC4DRAFT_30997 [Bipolaris maydis ATCC 48331]